MSGSARISVGEQFRLFPCREMTALVGLVEVDEVVVGVLHPVARRLEELVREHAVGDRELDVRRRILERGRCRSSGLPVQPRRGGPPFRQPVQRDVVEDVVPREAARGFPSRKAREIFS